jgi:transposase InsO family protein
MAILRRIGGADKNLDQLLVQEGVLMYDKDVVELALYALEIGHTQAEAAEIAGTSRRTVSTWKNGLVPHVRNVSRKRNVYPDKMVPSQTDKDKGNPMPLPSDTEKRLYEPPKTGPLAGLEPSQIENLLLRAVLADLKAGGWDPASISNKSKCELGERLRLATGLPLRSITAFLRISKSSYEYHRVRLGRDKYAELRQEVRVLFEEGSGNWGYRTIWAHLKRSGMRVSEKVVRRIMREEGLSVVYNRKRGKGWSSYEGEVSKAPANLVARNFRAKAPDELWLTDITEFKLPSGKKVYLSPILDCFDGRPVAWRIGPRPDKELANGSLLDALACRRPGSTPVIHSDRGGHYRWPEWVAMCEYGGLTRSMSAKACCADNSACEGFFGRIKNEFFYYRDWKGVSFVEFAERLDAYLKYYCEGRIKKSLGWMSPNEYRRSLGYAV